MADNHDAGRRNPDRRGYAKLMPGEQPMQKRLAGPENDKPLQGLSVLLAEDDAFAAQLITQHLASAGARVIGPCLRVSDARETLRQQGADFILIDMGLIDAFADELAEDARTLQIPFAIVTGFEAMPTNADEGAVAVFIKPVQRQQLIDALSPYA
jgi:DNA-binding NtrC family response regulator